MILALLACTKTVTTEICEDGWERPVGECPEGEADTDSDSDSDSDTDTDMDADTDADCEAEVNWISPDDGATDASIIDPIRIGFSDAIPEGELWLEGVDGQLVWGDNEDSLAFWPSAPLSPSTEYEAVAEACGRRMAVWHFTTGEHGQTSPGDLVGRTWSLDAEDARVIRPEGVGDVLKTYLEGSALLHASAQDGDELTLQLAVASDTGKQDLCRATEELVVDFSGDPVFVYGPQDTESGLLGSTIQDLTARGVFSADGSSIGGLAIRGVLDTRPLNVLIDEDAEDDAFCSLVAGFGIECVPCLDGTDLCLEVELEGVSAAEVGHSFVALETCDASCPEEDCGVCACSSGVGPGGGWMLGLLGALGLLRRRR
jgi:MYXO-CTERM domain-containing protein